MKVPAKLFDLNAKNEFFSEASTLYAKGSGQLFHYIVDGESDRGVELTFDRDTTIRFKLVTTIKNGEGKIMYWRLHPIVEDRARCPAVADKVVIIFNDVL